MNTTYAPLFTISATHTYYADGCKDLDFVVPVETAALLKNGRMLVRVRDGVLHVLCEVDAVGAPRIRLDGRILRFGIQLENSFFTNFTTLSFEPGRFTPVWDNICLLYTSPSPRD